MNQSAVVKLTDHWNKPNMYLIYLFGGLLRENLKVYKKYLILHSNSNRTLIWHCVIEKQHTGHNLRVQKGDPTAHAEVVAIRSCGQVWWFSWHRDNVDNFLVDKVDNFDSFDQKHEQAGTRDVVETGSNSLLCQHSPRVSCAPGPLFFIRSKGVGHYFLHQSSSCSSLKVRGPSNPSIRPNSIKLGKTI